MWITSRKTPREFWAIHPDAEAPLRRWLDIVEAAEWRNPADVRATFSNADSVDVDSGRKVWVFNIAGNKFRLIGALRFRQQRVFVLRILTHAEYDRERWKKEL